MGFALVTRRADLTEVWYDRTNKLLWSDRIPEKMDYKRAQVACPSLNSTYAELGSHNWHLPSADDYRNGEFLIQVLPNMMRYSEVYWFWTSTTKGRIVLTFHGEKGELGYNPFSGSNSGSVRCVAQY